MFVRPRPPVPPSQRRPKSDKATVTACVLLAANLLAAVIGKWDNATMSRDITDIRERVARIEATLEMERHNDQQRYGLLGD